MSLHNGDDVCRPPITISGTHAHISWNDVHTTAEGPTPFATHFRSRADSGIELGPGDVVGLDTPLYDRPLAVPDYRLLHGSDPFAWQIQNALPNRNMRASQGGYSWTYEQQRNGIRTNDRTNRIWENYFWSQGDRNVHFPPIRVMSSVPESKFERIALCAYPPQQVLPRFSTAGRPHHERCLHVRPHFRQRYHPLPTPHNELYEPTTAATVQYRGHDVYSETSIRIPPGFAAQVSPIYRPTYDFLLDPPDRFYSLGEEAAFILRDGQYTPLRDKNGRVLGDRYVQWAAPTTLVILDASVQEALHQACRKIYVFESTKKGRYLSWSSQVGERWTLKKEAE